MTQVLVSVPCSIRTMVGIRAYKKQNGAYEKRNGAYKKQNGACEKPCVQKPCVQKEKPCVQNARFETVRFVKTVRFPSPCTALDNLVVIK